MSRSQGVLAAVLGVILLLGLPAFLIPRRSVVQSTQSQSLSYAPIPETRLYLEKTSEKRREEIRYEWKVNLNTATSEKLRTIPGVGPNMAREILKYREKGHHFYRVSDLDKISGFGTKTVDAIRPHVKVGKDFRKKSPPGDRGASKIDINTAPQATLEKLDGVGPVTARRIIAYREANGSIESVEQLDDVSGIGSATVDRILPELKGLTRSNGNLTGTSGINVNTAGKRELEELPGVGPVTARRIIEYRSQHGTFSSLDDLEEISGIGEATVEGMRDVATVR